MSKQMTGVVIGAVVIVAIAIGVIVATGGSGNKKPAYTAGPAANSSKSSSDMSSMSSQAVATNSVEIKDYMFTPMAITVKAGDTVTWTNKDSVQHNVVADTPSSDAPDGPLLAQGESYKFTFNKAGTYSIHCMPHPYMKATVTVTQ
ncbi:MAG: putative plastocyanin-like protein [Candidatus Saccharibacteria bacterium]|nr:putative plastocyanin-like protein [Candidatus Saccharibacteria bacterium]